MKKQLQQYLDADYLTDEHLAGFDSYKVSIESVSRLRIVVECVLRNVVDA